MENIPQNSLLLSDVDAAVGPTLISVVGAGGKTSTLFWLAHCLQQAGRRVLITTTTHMYLPDACPVVVCGDPCRLPARVWQQPLVACFTAWLAGKGKVRGFSAQTLDALAVHAGIDVILVEADGAHGFAIKAPAEHEPCIPLTSCSVIAVTGAQLIGQPLGPDTVHRWPLFSRLTGAQQGDRLDFALLRRLVSHPQGAFKGAPVGSRRIWLLNQISHNENAATRALSGLLAEGAVDAIWMGAVRENPAITRRITYDSRAWSDRRDIR